MSRVYLFILILTLIAGGALTYTLWKLPPQKAEGEIIVLNLILLAVSLTVALTGILSFVVYLLRRLLLKTDSPRIVFRQSLREALFISFVLDILLLFQKLNVLTVINVFLLILIFITLEIYLLYLGKIHREQLTEKEHGQKMIPPKPI